MKKFIFSFCFIALFSCSEGIINAPTEIDVKEETDASPYLVEESVALEKALVFFESSEEPISRSNVSRVLLHSSRISNEITRSSDINSEGFYLFNFDENQGFSLVSADTRDSVDVYMASENGNLDINTLDSSSTLSYLISCISDYQESKVSEYNELVSRSFNPDKDGWEEVTTTTTLVEIASLLTTNWTQVEPYNYAKSNYFMGCVPVAIGQIMAYHRHPESYEGDAYYWDLILEPELSYSVCISISKLLLNIGTVAETTYVQIISDSSDSSDNEYGSSTSEQNIQTTFTYFDYSASTLDNYSLSTIKSSLQNSRPVFMLGVLSDDDTSAHAWVVDGYKQTKKEVRAYDYDGNALENSDLYLFNYDVYSQFLHLNTGYGTSENGYYGIETEYTCEYSDGTSYSNIWMFDVFEMNDRYYYKSDFKMIANIYPNN